MSVNKPVDSGSGSAIVSWSIPVLLLAMAMYACSLFITGFSSLGVILGSLLLLVGVITLLVGTMVMVTIDNTLR